MTEEDVRFFLQQVFRPEWFLHVPSNHIDLPALNQHPRECFSQQTVLRGHKDAWSCSSRCTVIRTRGAFLRRDACPAIAIRIDLSHGLLCYMQNLARTCIHSGMSSMSLSSHACTERRDG